MADGVTFDMNPLFLPDLVAPGNYETGRALLRIGQDVRVEVVRLLTGELVNVRSGRLRSSINAQLTSYNGSMACIIGSDVVYAPYVHAKGRPYLTVGLRRGLAPYT